MKHPLYWKVRATFLELQVTTLKAKAEAARVNEKFAAVMREAGLDPDGTYHLEDADETITVPASGQEPPIDRP